MPHMKGIGSLAIYCVWCAVATLSGCSGKAGKNAQQNPNDQRGPSFFRVNPDTAAIVVGNIRTTATRPARKLIDMTEDPSCVKAHHGKAYDESLVISPTGTVANAFVYIKAGLEGKNFEPSKAPITLEQSGCSFYPRVLGIQTGQLLQVTNSDPVTHNIHPLAEINREWNHSQGPGDAPLARKFAKPEVMIKVKCNIHSWMHAFIGVVDNPYFTVSKSDGSFEIRNIPPGTYTLGVWQERLGTQEQQITVQPRSKTVIHFMFKGK